MILHYQTIGLVIAIVGIVTTLIMFTLWRINKEEHCTKIWAFAALLTAIGFSVLWLRPIIGSYTTFINNSLALAGTTLILEGILQFRKIGDCKKRKNIIVIMICIFIIISFINKNQPVRRYLVHDAIQFVISILSAFVLLYKYRNMDRVEGTIHILGASFFIFFAIGMLTRWILALTGQISLEFQSQPIIGIIFLFVLLYMIGWSFSFSLMINYRVNRTLNLRKKDLEKSISEIKTLKGIIPICANCKNIRTDKGYWKKIEVFIKDHSDANFSHGICPDCAKVLYPDIDIDKIEKNS